MKNDDSVLEPENANVPDSSNDTDGFSEFMYTPEIVSGRTTLMESDDFEEILKNREALLSAFNDMKRDKNFQNKKIRFVIELAYD